MNEANTYGFSPCSAPTRRPCPPLPPAAPQPGQLRGGARGRVRLAHVDAVRGAVGGLGAHVVGGDMEQGGEGWTGRSLSLFCVPYSGC